MTDEKKVVEEEISETASTSEPDETEKTNEEETVNADEESGIVLEELQKGYMLKDRVIRPSMVKVNA